MHFSYFLTKKNLTDKTSRFILIIATGCRKSVAGNKNSIKKVATKKIF